MTTQSTTLALAASRAATGPRTPVGKRYSRYNAIKHGIFSRSILLASESPAQYNSLLAALRDSFRPQSGIEHLLVEKLATLLWRHRRLLVAERAAIDKSVEFLAWEEETRQQLEAGNLKVPSFPDTHSGLTRRLLDPGVLDACLRLLAELREGIASEGFVPHRDKEILVKLYGRPDAEWVNETLFDSYEAWRRTAEAPEEECREKGYASPEECKKLILREIDQEMRSLRRTDKALCSVESSRTNLEVLRRNVPDTPEMDRLLRYEAALERAFDRTLSQLERLQRLRKGQPVPPEIKLSLAR